MSFDLLGNLREMITSILDEVRPLPRIISDRVGESLCHLLDSEIIIEYSGQGFGRNTESGAVRPFPNLHHLDIVEQCIDRAREDGFGSSVSTFFGLLGLWLVRLAGDDDQLNEVLTWVKQGKRGAFCLTDSGGPNLIRWKSIWDDGPPSTLQVDKIWSMNAVEAEFAIVVVRRKDGMIPLTTIVPPEGARGLSRIPAGPNFLDETLSIGSLRGTVACEGRWVLRKGGGLAPRMLLTCARPRLIRAQCNHVRWLDRKDRLHLEDDDFDVLEYIERAALLLSRETTYTRRVEDRVMALKLLANEFWISLIKHKRTEKPMDQRDLFAFAKMEGSSYRCFLEMYQRNARHHHDHA